MLKLLFGQYTVLLLRQPPLGGCVLKPNKYIQLTWMLCQPPLGGCVLKPNKYIQLTWMLCQPPLGGCVLKLSWSTDDPAALCPAAFRRLCVETKRTDSGISCSSQPPLGGCVLKLGRGFEWTGKHTSRL